ncbi:hypothetical protein ACWCXB_00180 [Streptomyces sp. NPDC001514]
MDQLIQAAHASAASDDSLALLDAVLALTRDLSGRGDAAVDQVVRQARQGEHHTADPVHLVRLFGIAPSTAVRTSPDGCGFIDGDACRDAAAPSGPLCRPGGPRAGHPATG